MRLTGILVCLFVFTVGSVQALDRDEARHLLTRTGFGASPEEIDAMAPLSWEAAVAQLINEAGKAPTTDPPDWINTLPPDRRELEKLPEAERQEKMRERQRLMRQRGLELKGWWINEMVVTPTPLTERMTLFWHNHFTSEMRKVKSAQVMWRQNQLLRSEALGNFETLLRAIAKDPAMVIYLDGATNRKGKPNENFARELLELFTLGEGHYTEQDIKEAARAFTGWSVNRYDGSFKYRRRMHDGGPKVFMERAGDFNGDDILTIVLEQPRTATYLVEKLWREFISPTPDATEVERLAEVLREERYEIKPVLFELLTCKAMRDPANRGTLIKSPIDLVVGTSRSFGVKLADPRVLWRAANTQGQNLFDPPNVKGWPGGEAWVDSNTLLVRRSFLANAMTAIGEVKREMIDAVENDEPWELAEVNATGETMMQAMSMQGMRPGACLSTRMPGEDAWVAMLRNETPERFELARRALLPLPPVDAPENGKNFGQTVRAWVLDPVYQLK